jgi:hypothetical protein
MIAKSPTMPVDVTGVPNMSPPDNQSMAGSLDSLGDVTFEVDMSNSSYTGGARCVKHWVLPAMRFDHVSAASV